MGAGAEPVSPTTPTIAHLFGKKKLAVRDHDTVLQALNASSKTVSSTRLVGAVPFVAPPAKPMPSALLTPRKNGPFHGPVELLARPRTALKALSNATPSLYHAAPFVPPPAKPTQLAPFTPKIVWPGLVRARGTVEVAVFAKPPRTTLMSRRVAQSDLANARAAKASPALPVARASVPTPTAIAPSDDVERLAADGEVAMGFGEAFARHQFRCSDSGPQISPARRPSCDACGPPISPSCSAPVRRHSYGAGGPQLAPPSRTAPIRRHSCGAKDELRGVETDRAGWASPGPPTAPPPAHMPFLVAVSRHTFRAGGGGPQIRPARRFFPTSVVAQTFELRDDDDADALRALARSASAPGDPSAARRRACCQTPVVAVGAGLAT